MTLKERVVLRVLGIRISEDGERWTAPRKREALVLDCFKRAVTDAWRDGANLTVTNEPDGGITVTGPKRTITLRWLP